MNFIFLDESGNLGFDFTRAKTSQYFVITLLLVKNKRPIEKIARNALASLSKKQQKLHDGYLHAYKEQPRIRKKILNDLKNKSISVFCLYVNKGNIYPNLRGEKQLIYNYATKIILDRLFAKGLIPNGEKITLIASRRETNRYLNDNFKTYLTRQIRNLHKTTIEIEIKTPQQEKCLQIVDLLCWSIYRKWEH